MIKFACPNCSHHLAVKDEHAGKETKCPHCGGPIAVPVPSNGPPSAEPPMPLEQQAWQAIKTHWAILSVSVVALTFAVLWITEFGRAHDDERPRVVSGTVVLGEDVKEVEVVAEPPAPADPLDATPLRGPGDLFTSFLKHFKPVDETVVANMPAYALPLDWKLVSNLDAVQKFYFPDAANKELLARNGFVVVNSGRVDDITDPYRTILNRNIPIFVTADTVLHLFHIQFDETLKEVEETHFYPDITEMTRAMLTSAQADYAAMAGPMKEAAKRNVAYFSVALKQFDPEFEPPVYVRDVVAWECDHIEKHAGSPDYDEARANALFRIPEDYSQYLPRGHYTRSDNLKRYFRGIMWYGRMTFLMKGHEQFGQFIPPAKALVDRQTAKLQTLQSALIAARAGTVTLKDGRRASDVWDRIYSVTAFYVGTSDDLTIYEYRQAMNDVFGANIEPGALADEKDLARCMLELAKLRPPEIFSGTGSAGLDPLLVEKLKPLSVKDLDDVLETTQGFRFMGQRYIPDSYILGQLVFPATGRVLGQISERFTRVVIADDRIREGAYSIRGFPRGLDVFSVLGSARADTLITRDKDHEYPQYPLQLAKLRYEFAKLSPADWNRNLYWSWLYALKTLAEPRSTGYQSFQQTDAWTDRQLNSSLASWAALRHDTILYSKQSYTMVAYGAIAAPGPKPPPPPPPKGLVEPAPVFFARLLTTARMAHSGLAELKVLDGSSSARLTQLIRTLEKLHDLCKRQSANQPLTDADNKFLVGFPGHLKGIVGNVDEDGLKTTLIADVHTDSNTRQCLEEGSGYVNLVVVAYRRAEGDVVLAVGPVLSYYEFKHPASDRLTDEKWRKMLRDRKAPKRPSWNSSFTHLTD